MLTIAILIIFLLPVTHSQEIQTLNATCRDVCKEKIYYAATICLKNCTVEVENEQTNFGVFLNCSTYIDEKRKDYEPFYCGRYFCEQSYAFTNNTMILNNFKDCFQDSDSQTFYIVLFSILTSIFVLLFLLNIMRISFRCLFENNSEENFQSSIVRALFVSYSFIFSFLIGERACKTIHNIA